MKYVILGFVLALQIASAAAEVVPPRDVQALTKPILDLRAKAESAQGQQQQADFEQSEKLIGALFKKKSHAADEALVVLMNFYVGESLQTDLVHQITVRGKRMLPLLKKYRRARLAFSGSKYPASLLIADDVREKNFKDAIEAVEAGRVIGED